MTSSGKCCIKNMGMDFHDTSFLLKGFVYASFFIFNFKRNPFFLFPVFFSHGPSSIMFVRASMSRRITNFPLFFLNGGEVLRNTFAALSPARLDSRKRSRSCNTITRPSINKMLISFGWPLGSWLMYGMDRKLVWFFCPFLPYHVANRIGSHPVSLSLLFLLLLFFLLI